MLHVMIAVAALAAAPQTESLIGKVRLTRGVLAPVVSLVVEGAKKTEGPVRLAGSLLPELMRLQSAKLEVLGHREEKQFAVKSYRILDVGGGIKPVVGFLVQTAAGMALRDGDGPPIELSLRAAAKRRLQNKAGAKLWVSGKQLASGAIKVLRYGLLVEPGAKVKSVQPK